MTLLWNDKFKIGNPEIDAQHKELFALANQFLLATDKASRTIGAMGFFKYTREHFSHEERLMKTINYPAAEAHIAQHTDLVSKLNRIAIGVADDTLDHSGLEAFLSTWLLNHIGTSDTKLAAYVAKQHSGSGEAGTLAEARI